MVAAPLVRRRETLQNSQGGRSEAPPGAERHVMRVEDQRAIVTIALAAAFADGSKHEREREELRRVAESLQAGADINMAALVQEILLKRVDLDAQATLLSAPELRQLAFELAVGVCDADGLRNEAETRFLADLGRALGLYQPQMVEPAANADALATVPLAAEGPAPASAATDGRDETLDRLILETAVTNGALELLPQTLATMAILALQMRMVYRVGTAYGQQLDRAQVKDFLAAAGVGLTGQYLEQIGRRVVGGLFGSVAGNLAGAIARGATGAAFSFATTYALGQVAKRYYAGGRVMNAAMLKDAYAAMLAQAKALQARYQPQIEQRAGSIDATRLVGLVRAS
jgi:uncharacterized protein (DUF697 family)/tellurite resistance protein